MEGLPQVASRSGLLSMVAHRRSHCSLQFFAQQKRESWLIKSRENYYFCKKKKKKKKSDDHCSKTKHKGRDEGSGQSLFC